MKSMQAAIILLVAIVIAPSFCHSALQEGFYKGKCGSNDVEGIVKGVVVKRFLNDSTITAALLRMQFHDCFVHGCDASILLDGNSSEKTAPPNLSVRGYDIIDDAKAAVDKACPNVVSCADIIVMATRDAVEQSSGGRYRVQTGRKDGLVSNAADVNLPGPTISVSQSRQIFANKGLGLTDMVLLLGGHTVGVAHCSFFRSRLYNFNNTGVPDPNMDLALRTFLRTRCPQNSNTDSTVNLDQNPQKSMSVDNSFYQQIVKKRGVLQIDQALALDASTSGIVKSLASGSNFNTEFGKAMVKLGAVDVTGKGQIRKSCRAVNK